MNKLNIAIVGLGNIGSYLFKYLNENKFSVYTFTANESVTWGFDTSAIYGNGGVDASKFGINSSSALG